MKDKDYPAALRLKEDKFITCIGNIRLKVEKILADSQHFHYTRHDVKHSETIIKRIGELLEEHPGKLKEHERFILIAAAYLHDIGMQYPTYSGLPLKESYTIEELEKVRKNHHEASYKIIKESVKKDADPKLGLDELAYYVDWIAEVARHHRKLDLNRLEDTGVHEGKVRLKLLASLLRLSDALDLDHDRVITVKLNQRKVPIESKFHWWCHLLVRAAFVEEGKIQIYLLNPNYDKKIIDAFYRKIEESIKAPFYETYEILHQYKIKLYREPVFNKDKNHSEALLSIPEYLNKYIRENILQQKEKDLKISDQSGAVWYSNGIAYSDNQEFKEFWSKLTLLVENEKYYEAQLLIEGYEEYCIDPKQQMTLFLNMGIIYYSTGNINKALQYYEKTRRIAKRDVLLMIYPIEAKKIEVGAISNIGLINILNGDYKKALKNLHFALNIHREMKDSEGEAANLANIALAYQLKSDLKNAYQYFEKSLNIAKKIGHKKGEALNLGNMGLLYLDIGKLDIASNYFEDALKINKEIGYRKGEADILCNKGIIHDIRGDLVNAMKCHQESLMINQEIGFRQGEARQLGHIGLVFCNQGQYEIALIYLNRALKINLEIGFKRGQVSDYSAISKIFFYENDIDNAIKYIQDALTIHRELGCRHGEAAVLGNLGVIYQNIDKLDDALQYHQEALLICQETDYRQGEADQLGNIGVIYCIKENYKNAVNYLQRALNIHKEIGYKRGEANAYGNIGMLYINEGNLNKGLQNLKEALRIFKKIGAKREIEIVERNIKNTQKK